MDDRGVVACGKTRIDDCLVPAVDLGSVDYWVANNVTRYNERLDVKQARWEGIPHFEAENIGDAIAKCEPKKLYQFRRARKGPGLVVHQGLIGKWTLIKIVKGPYIPAPFQKIELICNH
jgi:hypothetical protein